MAAVEQPSPAVVRADLEAAALRLWGPDRLSPLQPLLERTTEALVAVAAFDGAPEDDPIPTGPRPSPSA